MKKQPEVTAATRRKLMDAFWALYREKEINKITISAITKKAGYNRGTFYAYFTDIYDLLEQLEDETVSRITDKMKSCFQGELPMDFQEFSGKCAEVFAEYGDKLFYLVSNSRNNEVSAKLKESMMQVVLNYTGFSLSEKREEIEFIQSFIFSAMLGMVTHWYSTGKQLDVKEFVRLAQTLVANGILGYTNVTLFK